MGFTEAFVRSESPEFVHGRFLEAEQAMHDELSQAPQTPAQAEAARPQRGPHPRCLIVGMGASAGGLAAFEQFFTQMPPDSGMAFVLVQHLAPDRDESLAGTAGEVHPDARAAGDGGDAGRARPRLRDPAGCHPDHLPAASWAWSPRPVEPRGHRTPIDHFFRSLAEDQGENAVCIILSGTGTDGTLGLQAVKEYGGMAMAQTPASAQYDSILRSAIATGLVDHILPVEDMPAKLIEYATHLTARRDQRALMASAREGGEHLSTIHGLLRRQTGHDFSQYKETHDPPPPAAPPAGAAARRRGLPTSSRLRQDPKELEFLFKDLLIGVTHFFRDPEAFTALARDGYPPAVRGQRRRRPGARVRVRVRDRGRGLLARHPPA